MGSQHRGSIARRAVALFFLLLPAEMGIFEDGANLPIEITKWPDAQRTVMLARSGKSLARQGANSGEKIRKWLWLKWLWLKWLKWLLRAGPNENGTPGCSDLLFRALKG